MTHVSYTGRTPTNPPPLQPESVLASSGMGLSSAQAQAFASHVLTATVAACFVGVGFLVGASIAIWHSNPLY